MDVGTVRSSEVAFTLIEITFALVILAGSLIVLIGLQSSAIERAVRDRNAQHAMLITRELLSVIETRKDADVISNTSGPVDEVLKDVLLGSPLPSQPLDPEQRFRADIKVSVVPVPVPAPQPPELKRFHLTIAWGDTPTEQFETDYFIARE